MGRPSSHSRRDFAPRAGMNLDDVDRLIEVGLLRAGPGDMFSEADVRRARWIRGLERSGVSLDDMAEAVRDGALSFEFLGSPAFDRFAGHSETTFRQLGERTGVPFELLAVVREAAGFAEPAPDDQVREHELAVVPAIELQLAAGFRSDVIEGWLRASGDSLRRIAETEAEWWKTEVTTPLVEEGMQEGQMLGAQADLGARMAPLAEQAIVALYRGQQEHAWSENAVEYVEASLERAGLIDRLRRPPAMCFLDITGYTRLTEERGDEAAAGVAATLSTFVRRSSSEHGGQPVKWLGDGVMFHFRDPGQGVVAALEMVDGVAGHGLPPAHVGLHAGPVVFQGGDYFGRTVNVAARIAEYARPGEVLVSQEVVDAARGAPVTFTSIGPVELKGVSGALQLHRVARGG
ncbi:MAG: adenylate/guanylate cyclase domain-containing protein [Actinomycetota bacterium]